jgi:hypothetical protein
MRRINKLLSHQNHVEFTGRIIDHYNGFRTMTMVELLSWRNPIIPCIGLSHVEKGTMVHGEGRLVPHPNNPQRIALQVLKIEEAEVPGASA